MSSKWHRAKWHVTALLALASCYEGAAEEVALETFIHTDVVLNGRGEDQLVDTSGVSVRWEVESAPADDLHELRIRGVDTTGSFAAEGTYVLRRWLDSQLSTVNTHRFTVSVVNAVPRATIEVADAPPVGELVTLDGSSSYDHEGADLEYTWTLASRPDGSTSELTVAEDSARSSFTPDVVGIYRVELTVFDGQHVSEPAVATLFTVAGSGG